MLILFSSLQAETINSEETSTISQDEFLQQLIKRHPLFAKEKLTAQINKEERNSHLGAEDWNFFSSLTYSHEEPSISITGPERTDAIYTRTGIEKLFWKTGGRFSASFSSLGADMRIDPLYGMSDKYYENKLALSYVHPLLKNRRGFLERLHYDLKQYDINFSNVRAQENMEDFLAHSAKKFLDWTFLSIQKQIVQERLKLSEEELERTRKKREANLIDQADVIRAEDALRFWRQNLVLVKSQWLALQAELAVISQNNELYNYKPEYNLYEIKNPITLNEAITQMKKDSRHIKQLNITVQQLYHTLRGYKETAKPDLSLIMEFNTKNADEYLGKSLEMDKPDAVIGLQLSIPLGNRTARSEISKTKLQISQLEKEIDDLTLTMISVFTSIYIQFKELEKVLQLNQEQISSAGERTEEELKLYNQGRGELTFVIQSRDNEQNARLTYARNALTYQKLYIEYMDLIDRIYNKRVDL